MATITVTRNTAVYTPPKKSTGAAKKPVRQAVKASGGKSAKPEAKKRTENQKPDQKSKLKAPLHRLWTAFDAAKLQNEILKAAAKHDTKHSNMEWGYAFHGEKIAVTNRYAVWFIPKGNWYLNIETVFRGREPYHLETVIENRNNAEKIELTAESRNMNDGRPVRIFKNPKTEEEIWINAGFLKLYDLERLQFEGTNKISPVYIYDNGELAGIVLPINH